MNAIERKRLEITSEDAYKSVVASCFRQIYDNQEKRIDTAGWFDPDLQQGPSFRMWFDKDRNEAAIEIDFHDFSNEEIMYVFTEGGVRKEGSKDERDYVVRYTSRREEFEEVLEGEIFNEPLNVSDSELLTIARIIVSPVGSTELLESLPRLP
jgi:hypothetical protein